MATGSVKIAAVLIIIIGGVTAFFGNPRNIPFWEFRQEDVVRLFTQLILIALIIERALEVMLTPWREPAANAIGRHHGQAALTDFKTETQSIAFKASFAVGVIVSLVGVRSLHPLVEPNTFLKLPWYQQSAFNTLDVLFTGALLSGGADGLHKILSLFLDYVAKTRSKVQAAN
jgi:hypothetical protein